MGVRGGPNGCYFSGMRNLGLERKGLKRERRQGVEAVCAALANLFHKILVYVNRKRTRNSACNSD